MKETIIAIYERESTLWKNANAFYVSQDWVKMECLYVDKSDEREFSNDYTVIDKRTGKDITAQWNNENLSDVYVIRFTNKRGNNQKSFSFKTKDEANDFFKGIMKNKILNNFHRAI